MQYKDLLFEIGVEEIPAGYISSAVKKLTEIFETSLKEKKLSYKELKTYSTPRRMAIKISEVQDRQNDEVIERVGPAKQIAYDAEGNLSKAAQGFLRGAGATEEDIFFVESPKGDKLAVRKEIKGVSAAELIPEIAQEAINKIYYPKTMRWGAGKLNFARPIRWFVFLFGDEVVDLEIGGVKAGRTSFGNRFQKLINPIEIDAIENYESKLEEVAVIADRDKRKQLILVQIEKLFAGSSEKIIEDRNLLETITDLVEFPTAVIGEFPERYLELPAKIITSTLSQHQKYFAVQNAEGELSNKFVFASNGNPEHNNLIRLGNEKVITPRLEDAEFFYQEDSVAGLASYVPKLEEVTFQSSLGSLLEKTKRIMQLAAFIAAEINMNETDTTSAVRAAELCKADLVTLMLGEKEFTKLQGYMGMQYARKSGETEAVANAIYEHYQPRGQKDGMPESLVGAVVAIADKIDTVCGIIGVGMMPTGSSDPFALRRAANGIVQIIESKKMDLNLEKLINKAFELVSDKIAASNSKVEISDIQEFLNQRVVWLLKEFKVNYDVIDSIEHIGFENICDIKSRAEDLQKFRAREDFTKLVLGFKRVSNIIEKSEGLSEVNSELFEAEEERNLFTAFQQKAPVIDELLLNRNYEKAMEELVAMGPVIDAFFDEVMVNVEDSALRQNRLNLLGVIRELFRKVAFVDKIVV